MNEKEKKSLIIISSVFIFILVFMVFFTFYRRDAMLSDRTIPKINTEIDPPSHGDVACSESSSVTEYYCGNERVSAGTCCSGHNVTTGCPNGYDLTSGTCCPSGTSFNTYHDGRCSNGTSPVGQNTSFVCDSGAEPYTSTFCTKCPPNSYLSDQKCYSCPGTHPISSGGSGGIDSCHEATPAPTATPTPTPAPSTVNCCVNGTYRTSISSSYCSSLGGTVVTSESQCKGGSSSSTPTPTAAPTATPEPTPVFSECNTYCSKSFNPGSAGYSDCMTNCSYYGTPKPATPTATPVANCDNMCREEVGGPGTQGYADCMTSCSYTQGGVYCPAGQGYSEIAKACSNCNKGWWSAAGASSCIQCPSGYTTASSGATSSTACFKEESDDGECDLLSVTTTSNSVSITQNGTWDSNSFYVVTATVSSGCKGKEITCTATNGNVQEPSSKIVNGTNIGWKVFPVQQCANSVATVTIEGQSDNVTIDQGEVFSDWRLVTSDGCFSRDSFPVTFSAADAGGYLEYYDDWGSCGNGNYGFRQKWERYGCGGKHGSGGTTSTSEDPNPPETYYCYVKRGSGAENQYCNNTESFCSNLGFSEKVTSGTCGETKACYLRKSDNTYVVGKYSGQSGYTYYGDSCPEKKCYIKKNNSGNEYLESVTNPGSGWSEYSGVCYEGEACYLISSKNQYVYGRYNGYSGYTKVANSNCEQIKCYINISDDGNEYVQSTTNPGSGWEEYDGVCSEDNACYLRIDDNSFVIGKYKDNPKYKYYGTSCPNVGCFTDEEGNYVWGDFESNSKYTRVEGITDNKKCGVTPDVPKTDMNVQTIVYIAVAVMSVAGIYFVVRYNNKSKKI